MVQREEEEEGEGLADNYIQLYVHHTGYEREHEVLKPDPKMAVHKLSPQAKEKTVMAPNK